MIRVLSVYTTSKNTVVNYPINNGTTFEHESISVGPCFWLFWFSGSKPATARTNIKKQFNPFNSLLIMLESK